jgi:high-affinity K+ transport system ATPase subunit B
MYLPVNGPRNMIEDVVREKTNLENLASIGLVWLSLWCLTVLSTIFQLFDFGQFVPTWYFSVFHFINFMISLMDWQIFVRLFGVQ